jgi:hypothetical protein
MQARMEVALAKERESLAEARATIGAHKITLDERVKATEEACKRQALDDFMHDIRVEERSYVRETKSLDASKKIMVMQERIFFRNIPLSNWIEREMLIEDGLETRQLATESLFTPPALPTAETSQAIAKLLQEVNGAGHKSTRPAAAPLAAPQVIEPVLLTQHATAFGAQ